jgi:23S rRNA (cytosine1962-C5)-methyltransferase
VVVDRYGDTLVAQFSELRSRALKSVIVDTVARANRPDGLYERSDASVRSLEGLPE